MATSAIAGPSSASSWPLHPLSVTPSSLGSHLLPTEEILSLCSSVGLYLGNTKLAPHQDGTVYLTSHRVVYIDEAQPRTNSVYLNLADIKLTEHYARFLKSSPKIVLGTQLQEDELERRAEVAKMQDEMAALSTIGVAASPAMMPNGGTGTASGASASTQPVSRWVCTVCGFSNNSSSATTSGGTSLEVCQLCGVKKDPKAVTSMASAPPKPPPTLAKAPSAPPSQTSIRKGPEIPCPTCTFLNHPSMARCEICDSPLGTEALPVPSPHPIAASASNTPSTSRPTTPGPAGPSIPRPQSTPPVASQPRETVIVKLSFRGGGDRALYDSLGTAIRRSAWKRKSASSSALPTSSVRDAASAKSSSKMDLRRAASLRNGNLQGHPSSSASVPDIDGRRSSTPGGSGGSGNSTPTVVGIDGLLSAYSSRSLAQTSDMSTALQDLKALMSKAKDMVDLAESLNAKLSKREAEAKAGMNPGGEEDGLEGEAEEEEAATLIRSSLVKLGLPSTAMTKEMARDEEEYALELARELGYALLGRGEGRPGLMGSGRVLKKGEAAFSDAAIKAAASAASAAIVAADGRGLVGLDEVWCIWNRLRGVALVSPSSLLSALTYLPSLTLPQINTLVLPTSGLRVLHTPAYSHDRFGRRVLITLQRKEEDGMLAEATRRSQYAAPIDLLDRDERENKEEFNGQFFIPPAHIASLTPLQLSQTERNLSILAVEELMTGVEKTLGWLVRDDQSAYAPASTFTSSAQGAAGSKTRSTEGKGKAEGGEADVEALLEAHSGNQTTWWRNRFRELSIDVDFSG